MPLRDKKKLRDYQKQWEFDNRDRIKKHKKQYWLDNKKRFSKYKKQYYKNNCEYIKNKSKEYRENNPGYNNEYQKKWCIEKRKTDLKYNLICRIRTAINISLKGKKNGRAWESLTGYNLADLIKRLNKTMPAGYTWKDILSGALHIDHKIPIDAFNFTRAEHTDFKRCWALENLRLLPAKENISKSNKLIEPFQPALRI